MQVNKKLEIEFVGEFAKVRLDGEEISNVDEIEIERIGPKSIARIRRVHYLNDLQIIGEPQGNFLNIESHDEDGHQIIKIGIVR